MTNIYSRTPDPSVVWDAELACSVCVTTYQRSQHLRWCLEALGNQTASYDDFEVIVVDDGGTDDSPKQFQYARKKFPSMQMQYQWHEHDGWGLSRSRNEAASYARGEILVFIDSDIMLNPRAVESFIDIYRKNPNRVIGGYYKYLKGMKITLDDIKRWFPIVGMTLPDVNIEQDQPAELGKDVREVHYNWGWMSEDVFADEDRVFRNPFTLLGGNIMVPRHIWKQTEGFDAGWRSYGGEDAEFSIQIANLGYGFSYSRRVGGCHAAHVKSKGAKEGTMSAIDYIRQKWPQWFTKVGAPVWDMAGWKRPPR